VGHPELYTIERGAPGLRAARRISPSLQPGAIEWRDQLAQSIGTIKVHKKGHACVPFFAENQGKQNR
jgi:predicted metal-dependent peptidase